MATDTDDLRFELSDRLATLTLNRPEKLNALSDAMIAAGIDHLRRCAEDPDVGAVLLTGAGRAFCAGGDVSAMGSAAREALTFEQRVDRQRAGQELSRRSEEHTSELQSPCNLVCRLLLEKKKKVRLQRLFGSK